jgi:hypothetical protein
MSIAENMNHVDESQRLDTLDFKGNWIYPSAASTGHVEIEIPSLPGSPNATERLHVRDFGEVVLGKIEASMNRQGYMETGPTQRPHEVFNHYVSVARGAQLMDKGTLSRMADIAHEFQNEPEQGEYFKQVLTPYLRNLKPKKR